MPPEELLEEVVRLRLPASISLLTRVRRSVDILFLRGRGDRGGGTKLKSKCSDVKLIFTLVHLVSLRPPLKIKLHSQLISPVRRGLINETRGDGYERFNVRECRR